MERVQDEEQGEAGRCHQGIPVGSEEFAHLIVGRGPDQGYCIHQHVKSNKQDETAPGERHYEFTSYG